MSQAKTRNITLERFAALFAEVAKFKPIYEAAIERRDAEVARRIGIPVHWSFRTNEEANAHLEAMREVDKEMGIAELGDRMDSLDLPLDRMVRWLVDKPALDLSDLALKANAVATAFPELWESTPDDLDWPEELIRDLIEAVCALAGVDLVARPRNATAPAAISAALN